MNGKEAVIALMQGKIIKRQERIVSYKMEG